ncbi:MAG: cytosine permease [Fuscovulum sp.]|nr:cytosine permease [Fuscovulum sp.]
MTTHSDHALHTSVAEMAGLDLQTDESWPLTSRERNWTSMQLAMVLMVTACATWCFVIGEYVGYYLGFKAGFAAMTAGSMIGMLVVALATVPSATKYGIDTVVSCRPQFGMRGWLIGVALQYISIIGWNSILLIFFGKSVSQLFITLGWATADSSGWISAVATVVSCAFVFLVLRGGASAVVRISTPLFVAILLIGCWMIYLLMTREWDKIEAATPAYASGSFRWDYVTGIELGIATLLSWWPYVGAMVRVTPSASKAAMPAMLGMGLPVPLLSVIGLAAILSLGVSDPSAWMIELGGPVYGVIALLFVIFANIGTAVTGVYATAIGLKNIPGVHNASWNTTLLLAIVPVAFVGLVLPDLFFNNFGTFLAFIGVTFGPMCAIQIVDYLILRRERLNIFALYDQRAGSPYWFWGGVNWVALAAMGAGIGTYLYLLDPISYASRSPYEYLTASLPTILISGVTYLVLSLLITRPSGKGSY